MRGIGIGWLRHVVLPLSCALASGCAEDPEGNARSAGAGSPEGAGLASEQGEIERLAAELRGVPQSGGALIQWPCAFSQSGRPRFAQDEYCEWTKGPDTKRSEGRDLSCDLWSNFPDDEPQRYPDAETRAYAFKLTDHGKDPNSADALLQLIAQCSAKPGAHCFNKETALRLGLKPYDRVTCVREERVSDRHVCSLTQFHVFAKNSYGTVQPAGVGSRHTVGFNDLRHDVNGKFLGRTFREVTADIPHIEFVNTMPAGCAFDVDPGYKGQLVSRLKAAGKDQASIQGEIARIANAERNFVACRIPSKAASIRGLNTCDDVAKSFRVGARIRVAPGK